MTFVQCLSFLLPPTIVKRPSSPYSFTQTPPTTPVPLSLTSATTNNSKTHEHTPKNKQKAARIATFVSSSWFLLLFFFFWHVHSMNVELMLLQTTGLETIRCSQGSLAKTQERACIEANRHHLDYPFFFF